MACSLEMFMHATPPDHLRVIHPEPEASSENENIFLPSAPHSFAPPEESSFAYDEGDFYGEADLVDLEAWLFAETSDELGLPAPNSCSPPSFRKQKNVIRTKQLSASAEGVCPLTSKLGKILRGAVEGIGCDSAALYTLDDATSELTMRAMANLSLERMQGTSRALHGSVADLEALCGKAVVLEDETLHDFWAVPELCQSAVCLPVATSMTILGTLWFFNQSVRDFSSRTVLLMELIAGSLAAEIELADRC